MSDEQPRVSRIPDVRYGAITRAEDGRGAFREVWRASSGGLGGDPYVQANLSTSATRVLRGLHLHRRQHDHWLVTRGRAFVALVDIRPLLAPPGVPGQTDRDGAAAAQRPIVETCELEADQWVDIPIGVAHGFLALEPLDLLYFVTNEYDGSDELGFTWDDPLAAVPWPTLDGDLILSDRDRVNPSLAGLVASLRRPA